MHACQAVEPRLVEVVLQRNAGPNIVCTKYGNTALHYLFWRPSYPKLISGQRSEIVKLLFSKGAVYKCNADAVPPLEIFIRHFSGSVTTTLGLVTLLESFIPKTDIIDGLELLGSIQIINEYRDDSIGYDLLLRAMKHRFQEPIIPKTLSAIKVLGNRMECRTVENLEEIKDDKLAFRIALLSVDKIVPDRCEKLKWHGLSYPPTRQNIFNKSKTLGYLTSAISLCLTSSVISFIAVSNALSTIYQVLWRAARDGFRFLFQEVNNILHTWIELLCALNSGQIDERYLEDMERELGRMLMLIAITYPDDVLDEACHTMGMILNILKNKIQRKLPTYHMSVIRHVLCDLCSYHFACTPIYSLSPDVQMAFPQKIAGVLRRLFRVEDPVEYRNHRGYSLLDIAINDARYQSAYQPGGRDNVQLETIRTIITMLMAYGCHVGAIYLDPSKSVQLDDSDVDTKANALLESIVRPCFNLTELSARVIRRHGIEYKHLPKFYIKFIEI